MTNRTLLIDFMEWLNEDMAIKTPEGQTNYDVVSLYLAADRAVFKPPPIDHNHIVQLFNTITGKKSTLTPARKSLMNGRAKDGNTMLQFEAVFKFKYNEWKHDPEMKKYITIETMLRASKFQLYLEEARADYLKRNPAKHHRQLRPEHYNDFNV